MAMAGMSTRPFDVADYLRTPEDAAAYLSAVLEENDPAAFRVALSDVARSRSMATVAEISGLGRESLYKALSPAGNPSFDTVQRVMAALGMTLAVRSLQRAAADGS